MVSIRGGDDSLAKDFAQLDLVPRKGRLVPLRTKDEVRAALETFEAYVIEHPQRFASVIKEAVKTAIPHLKTADFQHLRRVVQFRYLPEHLQRTFRSPRGDEESLSDEDSAKDEDTVRYFLVSPTTAIQHTELLRILRQCPPFVDRRAPPKIFYVTVPALAPTSAEQAAQWSIDFWPVAYKNTNPYGPHPTLVARNTSEIEVQAGTFLSMAQSAGNHTSEMNLGEEIGCIIVANTDNGQEIITAAGDCRWYSPTGDPESKQAPGNVMAHAVQRAISMLSKKRLRAVGKDPDFLDRQLFCDFPLTELEKRFYAVDNVTPNGYLCTDLDIYITHEPCVMCSMAILHSRFKRCVFGRRMPRTGGLTADTVKGKVDESIELSKGLGHGIFWRPSELNWKLLVWEWEDEDATDDCMITTSIPDTLQA